MKRTVGLLSLFLCACFLIPLALGLTACSSESVGENRVTEVTLVKGSIRVRASLTDGFLQGYSEKKVYLFELPSYMSTDGELAMLDPVAEATPRSSIGFSLSACDGVRSRLYSSFLVAAYDPVSKVYTPLTAPVALSNPEVMAQYPASPTEGEVSIKGLISDYPSDAVRLGISHTVVEVPMEKLILAQWQEGAVSYVYNGVTRYLRAETLRELDESVNVYTAAGVEVYLRFRLGSPDGEGVPVGLYLPSVIPTKDNAVNMTTAFSSSIIEGFFDFMAKRYAAPADGSKPVTAFLMGYCVNDGETYNHAGGMDIASYVTNYEKLVRVAHTALRTHNPKGRVYVSLNSRRTITEGAGWDIPQFLSAFREETALRGDFDWQVACELYADTPSVWEENQTADGAYYTIRNLSTLTDLLDGEKYRSPDGAPRRLLISGFSIPAAPGGEPSSSEKEDRQAASYAFAYLTCVQNGQVEALIYSRHTDIPGPPVTNEQRGLWRLSSGNDPTPVEPRPIYHVFRSIDTTAASELAVGLNAVIGTPFAKLESAMAGKSAPVTSISGEGILKSYESIHKKASPLYTFGNGHLCGFENGGNLTFMELAAAETLGVHTLHARFERTSVCEPMGITVTMTAPELIGAKDMLIDLYAGPASSPDATVKPTVTLCLTRASKGTVADGDGELRYEASVSEVRSGAWQTAQFHIEPFTSSLDASDEVTLTLLMDYPAQTALEGSTSHDMGLAGIYITGSTAATQTPQGFVIVITLALMLGVVAVFLILFLRRRKAR